MVSSLFIASSLFFTAPAPLDMPRAEGWIVRENGSIRLEDRFRTDDLWFSQTITGVWFDEENQRCFTLAELKSLPPAISDTATRTAYGDSLLAPDKRDKDRLRKGVAAVTPFAIADEYVRAHQSPRGVKEARYYEGTNQSAIVCAYLPKSSDSWSVAIWELAEGDDRESLRKVFEDAFFEEVKERCEKAEKAEDNLLKSFRKRKKFKKFTERDLLKRDALHSISAYDGWYFTPGEDFVILDDLKDGRAFVSSLTNDLAVWRGRFAAALPFFADVSDVLSVARIYRDRGDYLAAAGEDMQWSAAYWSPSRRELVACLPPDGDMAGLRRTFRHEAFHQYLSYATAMIQVSPWLNEGYAQYFEDEGRDTFDLAVEEEKWDELELALPAMLRMDYGQFYEGSDARRRTNYRVAWSVVYFIEHGMREIRNDPFKDLKESYFKALRETRDMRQATERAFGSGEALGMFCNEWKKFWKNRRN